MHSLSFVCIVFSSLVCVVRSALITAPLSSVILTGQDHTLHCLAVNSSDTYEWQYTAIRSGSPIMIVHECQINPAYASIYQAVPTAQGGCDVKLISTTGPMAGTYTCQHGYDQGSADVVVVSANSSCSYSPESNMIAGDPFTMTCYIDYNGTFAPTMEWRADNDEVMTNATVNTYPNQVNSRLTVPIYPPRTRVYVCETFFEPPIDFHYFWSSPAIDVQHAPTDIEFIVSGLMCDKLYAGYTTMTCSANGFPALTYQWADMTTNQTYDGAVLTNVSAGSNRYNCTAWNVIRDVTYVYEEVAQYVVYPGPVPPECIPTTTIAPTTTTLGPVTECGQVLHVAPNDTETEPGWYPMCYIQRSLDTGYLNTPCRDLIVNLPPEYANYQELLSAGGNFGCSMSNKDNDFANAYIACFDNYQQTIAFSSCSTCQMMYVCIRLPAASYQLPRTASGRRLGRRHK